MWKLDIKKDVQCDEQQEINSEWGRSSRLGYVQYVSGCLVDILTTKKKKTQNVKFLILSNKIEKKTLMTVECRSLRYEIRPYSWRQSATWQNVLEYCKIKLHFPETLSINMGASRMLDNERYENEMIQKSWDKTNLEKNSHQVEKIHTNQRFEIFGARYGLLINFDALKNLQFFEALWINNFSTPRISTI